MRLSLFKLILGLLLGTGVSSTAMTFEELSRFLSLCEKEGSLSINGDARIVDYERLSGGKSEMKVCIYDTVCNYMRKNIVNYHHPAICAFNKDTGCESLSDCIPRIAKREDYGFAKSAPISKKDRCTDAMGNRFIYGAHSDNKEDYTAVCVQELTCTNPTEYLPLVMCKPTGTKPVPGEAYELAVCPSPSDCRAKPLKLQSNREYLSELEAARVASENSQRAESVSSTVPRSSTAMPAKSHRGKP